MSKKKKNKGNTNAERNTAGKGGKYAAENYYDLKTDAVERLVNAKSAPRYSEKELKKYTSGGKFNIPTWLKIIFVKFWFSGAICYFFLWGLGIYISGLDMMFVLACGLGMVNDLMVNHLLHCFEPEKGAYDRWMMITYRKFWSIFLNVIYSAVVLFCVVQTYNVINTLIVGDVSSADRVAVPVEPLLFGIFYTGFDMLFITCKHTVIKIFRDAKDSALRGGK